MSMIKGKFLEPNAVGAGKMRLENNQALRARNAADSADVDLIKLSAADVFTLLRELNAGNNKITGLADPVGSSDAVTLQYLQNFFAGASDPKDAVRVATTAALPACAYDNGASGVGATLTASANGALPSIDGVGLSVGNRLLVKNQVAGLQNGIYEVSDLGSVGTPWVLTRTTDADGSPSNEVTQGLFTIASEGSTLAQQGFMLTTSDPITVGTTALAFTKFGEVVIAGSGITKTGTTLAVDAGAGLTFSGNSLIVAIDSSALSLATTKIVSGEVRGLRAFKQSFTLGAGDITNQYVDLSKVAHQGSVALIPDGGPAQKETDDFTLNYTGGASSKTRLTFAGDLATGGGAELVAGDVLEVTYLSLDY